MPTNLKRPDVRLILSRNLKAALRRAEWSEAELARRSGVSQKQTNNTAAGRTATSVEIVQALADALRVPVWVLLSDGLGSLTDAEIHRLATVVAKWVGASDRDRRFIEDAASRAE